MRSRTATIRMTFAGVALVLSTMGEATPASIWNASKSVPVSLYQLQPVGRLAVTELVAVRPPEPLATVLDLPISVPSVAISRGDGVYRRDLASSMLVSDAMHAEQAFSSTHRASGLHVDPFGVYHRGVEALRRAGALDTVGNARRECLRSAGAIAKRRKWG